MHIHVYLFILVRNSCSCKKRGRIIYWKMHETYHRLPPSTWFSAVSAWLSDNTVVFPHSVVESLKLNPCKGFICRQQTETLSSSIGICYTAEGRNSNKFLLNIKINNPF